jgi:hypothetical protein
VSTVQKSEKWNVSSKSGVSRKAGQRAKAIGCNDGKIKFAEGNPSTH